MDSPSREESSLIEIGTHEDWEQIQRNFADAIDVVLDAQLGPNASGAVREALRQHLFAVRKAY
jgi:hypothetical protein